MQSHIGVIKMLEQCFIVEGFFENVVYDGLLSRYCERSLFIEDLLCRSAPKYFNHRPSAVLVSAKDFQKSEYKFQCPSLEISLSYDN